MNKINDELKRKAKIFMLKAALTITAASGITGAAAQNTPNQDQDHNVTEQSYKKRHTGSEIPAFFGEKPIKLSKEQMWQMVELANLNESQMEYFIAEYAKLAKSPNGLTDKNFSWMLENAAKDEVFSKRQAEIMNNKAIEYNVPVKAPNEQVIEDGVRAGEEGFAINETFVNKTESKTNSDVKGENLSYSFDKEGALNVQYNGFVDLKGLMPPLVQQRDGSYRCGAATGIDRSQVIRQERSVLSRVVVENMVYQDLLSKKHNNEELGGSEQAFMKKHVQDLQKHGLSMGKKGLQQVGSMQMMKDSNQLSNN